MQIRQNTIYLYHDKKKVSYIWTHKHTVHPHSEKNGGKDHSLFFLWFQNQHHFYNNKLFGSVAGCCSLKHHWPRQALLYIQLASVSGWKLILQAFRMLGNQKGDCIQEKAPDKPLQRWRWMTDLQWLVIQKPLWKFIVSWLLLLNWMSNASKQKCQYLTINTFNDDELSSPVNLYWNPTKKLWSEVKREAHIHKPDKNTIHPQRASAVIFYFYKILIRVQIIWKQLFEIICVCKKYTEKTSLYVGV